ncbi:MAG: DUF6806 family protein [Limnohabitans sp.]
MKHDNAPFEIHVHGDIPIKPGIEAQALQEALKPLWNYAGARSLKDGCASLYEEESGLHFDAANQVLQMCWTVKGDDDFRMVLDDLCMNLNEVSSAGAQIEVTFYDTDFDEDEESREEDARDDFLVLFVGPDPAAIMQIQRDLLVNDVVHLMERHFDGSELSGVVAEIDKLFGQRFDNLVSSLDLGKPPRGSGPGNGHGGRRPRHLH